MQSHSAIHINIRAKNLFRQNNASHSSSGKKNKFDHLVVVLHLIRRLTQANISCTTTARLFFFPLLAQISGKNLGVHMRERRGRQCQDEREPDEMLRRAREDAIQHERKRARVRRGAGWRFSSIKLICLVFWVTFWSIFCPFRVSKYRVLESRKG